MSSLSGREDLGGWRTSLQAQLCVSVDESYARALTTARRWLEEGFTRLGGHFHDAALRSAPADLDVMARVMRGGPGAVSVMVLSKLRQEPPRPDGEPDGYLPYSQEAWEQVLLELGRVPVLSSVECAANASDGDSMGGAWLNLAVKRVDSGGGSWLVLSANGSYDMLAPQQQRAALLELLRAAAEQSDPVHGEFVWGTGTGQSVYEKAMSSWPWETLPNARRALRGYGWVTILAEEIGGRLGGVDALRDSGAFVEVERLVSGGYWCRATDSLETYDQAAAERVFDVVAAVLPPGQPGRWNVEAPNVLSLRDPAGVRPDRERRL
ncbi:hypothetical protein Daura_32735 [Dactylosporangium aurantiacum]|uniref:Uncharacterized protein n=1 Tax=Dactylosporangium aurantiacum TaxID=35754 RepID=A0A9Q9I975_9ACTN|nr:hypothetical protein [Dactylosporangium aurantiacum]MDG6107203.1 hypothetical protein [Dactylosporangium aurantiacum]UWZ51496.1 hypothetical protein Daura_32735 [Dactylosporangium aurantiacum]